MAQKARRSTTAVVPPLITSIDLPAAVMPANTIIPRITSDWNNR